MSFHVQEPALGPLDGWSVAGYTNDNADNNPNPQTSGATVATAQASEVVLGINFVTALSDVGNTAVDAGYGVVGSTGAGTTGIQVREKTVSATGAQEYQVNQTGGGGTGGISNSGAAWYLDCLPFKVSTPKASAAAMALATGAASTAGYSSVTASFGSATIVSGDLLVAVLMGASGGVGVAFTKPSGWTDWADASGNVNFRTGNYVMWKIADGTETGGNVVVTVTGSDYAFVTMNLGQQAGAAGSDHWGWAEDVSDSWHAA